MNIISDAGTNLKVEILSAPCRAGAGYLSENDKVAYWPAGLALFFPLSNTVNGKVVLDIGDVNLTFKKYFESKVTLIIRDDYVTKIEGTGLDADLLRSYYESWNDKNAYAISHVGWGLNTNARWDALTMYDKQHVNCTELRAFAGNFLICFLSIFFSIQSAPKDFTLPLI